MEYYTLDQIGGLAGDLLEKNPHPLRERKEDDLWDSPLIYLIFALIITLEWVLRKVWRML